MDWKNIPSLSALRAFEAAARLGNQSKAADELNVTQAAVAQHIRAIETHLGVSLFERNGRQFQLSRAGKTLFEATNIGLDHIVRGVHQAKAHSDNNMIKLTSTHSQYERWLMPRLQKFWSKYPEINLSISASSDFFDLEKEGYDLALRFGLGSWPPFEVELLRPADDAIFAAPSYLQKHPNITENLNEAHWLRSMEYFEYFPIHENLGIDFSQNKHRSFATNAEARAAMIAGLGLLVHDRYFLQTELTHNMVVEIAKCTQNQNYGYYLVQRPGEKRSSVKIFADWLREEAESERQEREAQNKTAVKNDRG